MTMEQMKTLSSLNELKSHPDKLLQQHLSNVGNLSRKFLSSKTLNLDKFIGTKILDDISYLIGIAHDAGKATRYFQDYLNEKPKPNNVFTYTHEKR